MEEQTEDLKTRFDNEVGFLSSLGFYIIECSDEKTEAQKDIRLCNSNCIGCEYCIGISLTVSLDTSTGSSIPSLFSGPNCEVNCKAKYEVQLEKKPTIHHHLSCILYKPTLHDNESLPNDGNIFTDVPMSRIFLANFDNDNFELMMEDLVRACALTMQAMDFKQISGRDFFDISKLKRNEIEDNWRNEWRRIQEKGYEAKAFEPF